MRGLEFLIDFNDGYLGVKTEADNVVYMNNLVNATYNKFLNSRNTQGHSFEYVMNYVLEELSKKYGFSYELFTWHEYEPSTEDLYNAYN